MAPGIPSSVAPRRGDPLAATGADLTLLAGRYRLLESLGDGATGVVYRGLDTVQRAEVAVKILHARHEADSMIAERFRREARAAARLAHPNCVHVIDHGTTATGQDFLVMPLVAGPELRAVMRGPLPVEEAAAYVDQILAGLEHAHAQGLVHRDVKPENVLVLRSEQGVTLKLVDFGLVKLLESPTDGPRLTKTGLIFGTPYYMSPEQASGTRVDARADLYAVGAVMYEMLVGRPPFDSESPMTVIRQHVFAEPPALPSHIPIAIRRFVMRLLAKDPADRYASATHARQSLAQALAGDASEPRLPSSSVERPASFSHWSIDEVAGRPDTLLRPRRRTAALALGLAAAVGVVLGALWLGPALEPADPVQPAYAGVATLPAAPLDTMQHHDPTPAPDVVPAPRPSASNPTTPVPAAVVGGRSKGATVTVRRPSHRQPVPEPTIKPRSVDTKPPRTRPVTPAPTPTPVETSKANKLPDAGHASGGEVVVTRTGKRILRPSAS